MNIEPIVTSVEIRFERTHPDAILPRRNFSEDSGLDVFAVEDVVIEPQQQVIVPVGLNLAYITPGYWLLVACRSGLGIKEGLSVHHGVIDQGYRGTLGVLLRSHRTDPYLVHKGDKIAQLLVLPHYHVDVTWGIADESSRGIKGFGSSGK